MKSGYSLLTQDVYNIYTTAFSTTIGMRGQLIQANFASNLVVTISDLLNIGDRIDFIQMGVGQLTFIAVTGLTILTSRSVVTRTQYSVISIQKLTDNTWFITGDLQ